MIHVYGIVHTLGAPVDLPEGIDGRPVDRVRAGTLTAMVSHHGPELEAVTLDRVLAHEAVVEAVMAERTVVPVRYGVHYATSQALIADVRASAGMLDASLVELQGRVELALRSASLDPAALSEVTAALREATVATVVEELPVGAKAALLIEADAVDAVRRAVSAEATVRHLDGLSLTGPWPPYSFVALGQAT